MNFTFKPFEGLNILLKRRRTFCELFTFVMITNQDVRPCIYLLNIIWNINNFTLPSFGLVRYENLDKIMNLVCST